jgi:peptidyl-prolyl cis-trans isomerase C
MRYFCFAVLFSAASVLPAQTPAQTPPPTPAPKAEMPSPAKAPAAAATSPDKVVLSVADEKMTAGQFQEFVDTLPEQYRSPAARRQIADKLVDLKTLAQEARKRKIDQKPAYKAQLAFQTESLLAGTVLREMSSNMKPEEAEGRKYYDAHKNEYERIKARHILIRFKGSPVPVREGKDLTEEEALAKAKAVREKLVAGADFAALAKVESDDAGSGANGGDLDFFSHGQMVPAFEQAAFSLPVGEVSQPVKSQFGYHLIMVEKHETKSFDEMRPEIDKQLGPEMAQKAIEKLKSETKVQIDDAFFGPSEPATKK